jgi:ferredoxin
VAADRSILETLEQAGHDLPFSCREGIRGSCETVVVKGVPS